MTQANATRPDGSELSAELGQVPERAKPRAWAIFLDDGSARMWGTLQPHVQKLADAEGLQVTPLYDQAALDAARMAGVRSVQEQTAVIVRAALELLESIEGETPFTAEALRTFKRVFGA